MSGTLSTGQRIRLDDLVGYFRELRDSGLRDDEITCVALIAVLIKCRASEGRRSGLIAAWQRASAETPHARERAALQACLQVQYNDDQCQFPDGLKYSLGQLEKVLRGELPETERLACWVALVYEAGITKLRSGGDSDVLRYACQQVGEVVRPGWLEQGTSFPGVCELLAAWDEEECPLNTRVRVFLVAYAKACGIKMANFHALWSGDSLFSDMQTEESNLHAAVIFLLAEEQVAILRQLQLHFSGESRLNEADYAEVCRLLPVRLQLSVERIRKARAEVEKL